MAVCAGMGERTLERLRNAHDAAQFTSIADVVRRARLTRAESTSLALAGAFGAWEKERRKASWEALRAVSDTLPFAPAHRAMHNPAPLGKHELIAIDYHSTGTSIHGHPMSALRERLRGDGVKDSRDLGQLRNGTVVSVAGMVMVRQRPQTSNGTIFLLLEDEHGFINVVVSKRFVEPNEEVVKRAQFVLIRGRSGAGGDGDQCGGDGIRGDGGWGGFASVAGFSLAQVVDEAAPVQSCGGDEPRPVVGR